MCKNATFELDWIKQFFYIPRNATFADKHFYSVKFNKHV